MYSAKPSFYVFWRLIAQLDCELFTDALNESGVLSTFCNVEKADKAFGSLGSWDVSEYSIMGSAWESSF